MYTQYSRKFVQKYKNLLCIYSTVETLYKNSAVEMLHLIDWPLGTYDVLRKSIILFSFLVELPQNRLGEKTEHTTIYNQDKNLYKNSAVEMLHLIN